MTGAPNGRAHEPKDTTMPNLLTRLLGVRTAMPETKGAQMLMSIRDIGAPDWTRRSFPALAQEGFMRNPIVHRCVRMIAESDQDTATTQYDYAVCRKRRHRGN